MATWQIQSLDRQIIRVRAVSSHKWVSGCSLELKMPSFAFIPRYKDVRNQATEYIWKNFIYFLPRAPLKITWIIMKEIKYYNHLLDTIILFVCLFIYFAWVSLLAKLWSLLSMHWLHRICEHSNFCKGRKSMHWKARKTSRRSQGSTAVKVVNCLDLTLSQQGVTGSPWGWTRESTHTPNQHRARHGWQQPFRSLWETAEEYFSEWYSSFHF